jgi:hypothetical protein
MSETLLFSSLTIRGVDLRNRILVPPMHQYFAIKGFRQPGPRYDRTALMIPERRCELLAPTQDYLKLKTT